jgi:hypothetical protein
MSTPNALLQSIINDVYTHTNRPDLVAETALAVTKATVRMHTLGQRTSGGISGAVFYIKDISTVVISLPTQADNHFSIDLSPYPLIRAVKTVQDYNYPLTGREVQYPPLDPENIFDSYNVERANYFFRAGLGLTLKCQKPPAAIQLQYYSYPITDGATYNSWIATDFRDAITEEAAGTVFRMIGKDEEFKVYQAMSQDNIAILQSSNITSAV